MKSNPFNEPLDSNETSDHICQNGRIMGFRYELLSKGKACGEFIYDESKVEFTVDNSTNPLSELLKGMINLIFEPSHIWGEENCSTIDWYTESGCLRWKISTENGNGLEFSLIHYTDMFDESTGDVLIESSSLMTDFYFAIVHELDIFIKRVGLLNYEQQWQGDEFPLTYFLVLKKLLIEKGSWIPSVEKVGSLSDEIDFLMA